MKFCTFLLFLLMSEGVSQISGGTSHTCAVQNGQTKCWGNNSGGQLGDGTQINRAEPMDRVILN